MVEAAKTGSVKIIVGKDGIQQGYEHEGTTIGGRTRTPAVEASVRTPQGPKLADDGHAESDDTRNKNLKVNVCPLVDGGLASGKAGENVSRSGSDNLEKLAGEMRVSWRGA